MKIIKNVDEEIIKGIRRFIKSDMGHTDFMELFSILHIAYRSGYYWHTSKMEEIFKEALK